jgi:hypothetical protein
MPSRVLPFILLQRLFPLSEGGRRHGLEAARGKNEGQRAVQVGNRDPADNRLREALGGASPLLSEQLPYPLGEQLR